MCRAWVLGLVEYMMRPTEIQVERFFSSSWRDISDVSATKAVVPVRLSYKPERRIVWMALDAHL